MKFSMNKKMTGMIGLLFVIGLTAGCDKKVKLDSDVKKSSYTIGIQFGNNLRDQKVTIDTEAFAMALRDAAEGKNQLTQDEMRDALQKLQESANATQKAEAEKNKKEGEAFLENNKKNANIKVTASGLQYEILTEGTGAMPKATDRVVVHYKGTLMNGEVFDSSYDRGEPATFPVSGLIPGWTEALQLMKVGSKVKLYIKPELAYGESGRPKIPPNSVLVFEMELKDIAKDAPAAAGAPAAPAKKNK
jgi:FKBP-type peptidyl-prolyl cis-trans isomerase